MQLGELNVRVLPNRQSDLAVTGEALGCCQVDPRSRKVRQDRVAHCVTGEQLRLRSQNSLLSRDARAKRAMGDVSRSVQRLPDVGARLARPAP
jgi:hypothetical protein